MSSKIYDEYEYLFIDIEWNQKAGTSDIDNREPIQIAVIGTDKDLKCQKLFSKSICLNNIETLTEETCKLTHVTKENVMQAKSEEEIFGKVSRSFTFYKYLVVWTISTYEIFRAAMKRTDQKMPRHKVLVLQDILNRITNRHKNCLGFETALMKAGISYEKNFLHYSKHDVKYLLELFQHIYFKYAVLTDEKDSIVNPRTKTIHISGCRYAEGKNYEIASNAKQLLFRGYKTCRCCEPERKWNTFRWKDISEQEKKKSVAENIEFLPLTEENIYLICRKFGIKCSIASNVIFLKTAVGYWRVYTIGDKVDRVFHGNYRISKTDFHKKKKKCNEGFHKQNVSMENFYDVVKYIYYHDRHAFQKKSNRMDKLFEQIEQERVRKELCTTDIVDDTAVN